MSLAAPTKSSGCGCDIRNRSFSPDALTTTLHQQHRDDCRDDDCRQHDADDDGSDDDRVAAEHSTNAARSNDPDVNAFVCHKRIDSHGNSRPADDDDDVDDVDHRPQHI